MPDAFAQFYADVNAEWPAFRQTAEEALQQERRWRFSLGFFPESALQHAMRRALTQCLQWSHKKRDLWYFRCNLITVPGIA